MIFSYALLLLSGMSNSAFVPIENAGEMKFPILTFMCQEDIAGGKGPIYGVQVEFNEDHNHLALLDSKDGRRYYSQISEFSESRDNAGGLIVTFRSKDKPIAEFAMDMRIPNNTVGKLTHSEWSLKDLSCEFAPESPRWEPSQ